MPAIVVAVSTSAHGQVTYGNFLDAVIAAKLKLHLSFAVRRTAADSAAKIISLQKEQEDRVKAGWAAFFVGNAGRQATRLTKLKAITSARRAAMTNLISASEQDMAADLAYKAAVLEVKAPVPDWGRGQANANLANLKYSAAKDYGDYANTGFLDTAVTIGEYKAWLDSILLAFHQPREILTLFCRHLAQSGGRSFTT